MKHASLFSGIGGFDLASEWLGWENIFHCEIDPFCQKVLKYHFPNSICYEDIKKTDFTKHRGTIDVLSGGFPCQDASIAKQNGNKQKGLEGDRTGLWKEMFRAIEEIKPKYIVAENVENILRTNNGRDFRTILSNLASLGYNAEWRVTRSSEVGACHNRSRMFLVAYSERIRLSENKSFFANVVEKVSQGRRLLARTTSSVGISWPHEPGVCFVDDGISDRLDGITFSKWRNESIKAAGNTIVPEIALQIFKAIKQFESCKS